MSNAHETFIELACRGDVLIDEIDDFVDQWHDSNSSESLASFLGMTPEEYEIWVSDDDSLGMIIKAHCSGLSIGDILNSAPEMRLAARSDKSRKIKIIEDWLKERNGR